MAVHTRICEGKDHSTFSNVSSTFEKDMNNNEAGWPGDFETQIQCEEFYGFDPPPISVAIDPLQMDRDGYIEDRCDLYSVIFQTPITKGIVDLAGQEWDEAQERWAIEWERHLQND